MADQASEEWIRLPLNAEITLDINKMAQ